MTSVSTRFFGQPRLTKWMRFSLIEPCSIARDVAVRGVRRALEGWIRRRPAVEGQAPPLPVGAIGRGAVVGERERAAGREVREGRIRERVDDEGARPHADRIAGVLEDVARVPREDLAGER